MPSSRLGLPALAALVSCVCVAACSQTASGVASPPVSQTTELRISLPGKDRIVRNRVRYTCDGNAAKLNLPSGPFTVEVGDNGLALVPVGLPHGGTRLIFSQVISASGERFAAREYEWGDKGPEAWLTSAHVGPDGKQPTTYCRELP